MLTCGGVFDGIGLLAYGLCCAGIEHRWLCEVDPWRRSVLERRWPGVPIFDDVRAVGAESAERVGLIAGGFPCKGASTAGKRNGFEHPETVLWREMARAVRELRPRYVLVENVANILALHDGAVWGEVLGDLAALGYDVTWDCLPAGAVGAPHLRDRVFAVAAYADGADAVGDPGQRGEQDGWPDARGGAADVADAEDARRSAPEPAVQQPRLGCLPRAGGVAAADARGDGVREQPEPESGSGGAAESSHSGRGVVVEWGGYEPAIRRWEAVHGPAPEPLVRRVDARGARRVERSRLSALGDGVQVQIGVLAGTHIVEFERARLMKAAA